MAYVCRAVSLTLNPTPKALSLMLPEFPHRQGLGVPLVLSQSREFVELGANAWRSKLPDMNRKQTH